MLFLLSFSMKVFGLKQSRPLVYFCPCSLFFGSYPKGDIGRLMSTSSRCVSCSSFCFGSFENVREVTALLCSQPATDRVSEQSGARSPHPADCPAWGRPCSLLRGTHFIPFAAATGPRFVLQASSTICSSPVHSSVTSCSLSPRGVHVLTLSLYSHVPSDSPGLESRRGPA